MLTDIQSIKQHTHDVEIIWEFWPFSSWTPSIIKTFLNGYGLNWAMTYLYDITFWPRMWWNDFFASFLSLFGVLDWIPHFIMWFPNILTGWLETIQYIFVAIPNWITRYYVHAADHETFYVLIGCVGAIAGLGYWAMDASGMMAEMMGPADGAAADPAAKA